MQSFRPSHGIEMDEKDRRLTLVDSLRSSLRRLASPPAEQRQYLEELGVSPDTDELALEFDDLWPSVRPFATGALRSSCDELDQWFSGFSGAAFGALWHVDALAGSEWERVRELAARALAALPAEPQRPDGSS